MPRQAERIVSIDFLRILAAVGIVWFHTPGIRHRQIGYAGLPIFLLIFYSLIARRDPVGTTYSFIRVRARRLLRPWLFWSLVYGLCELGRAIYKTDFGELYTMTVQKLLLCGPTIHLWYLPFAFVSGCLCYQLSRWLSHCDARVVAWVAVLIGLATLVTCEFVGTCNYLASPWPQWIFAAAIIPLGFGIGKCLTIPCLRTQRRYLASICAIVLAVCALLYVQNLVALSLPYGIAIAAVCLAYSCSGSENSFVATVAPLTFGIYLLHPLVAYGLRLILIPETYFPAFVGLTACISGLITWILARTRLRTFV